MPGAGIIRNAGIIRGRALYEEIRYSGDVPNKCTCSLFFFIKFFALSELIGPCVFTFWIWVVKFRTSKFWNFFSWITQFLFIFISIVKKRDIFMPLEFFIKIWIVPIAHCVLRALKTCRSCSRRQIYVFQRVGTTTESISRLLGQFCFEKHR